jgi:hypothetical protein
MFMEHTTFLPIGSDKEQQAKCAAINLSEYITV